MIRRLAEPLIFLSLATALHAAVWAGWSGDGAVPGGQSAPAGTIAAAGPELAAMVQDWTRAPSAATGVQGLAAPVLDARPVLPALLDRAPAHAGAQDLPRLAVDIPPQVDTAPPPPPPMPAIQPKPRPTPPVAQAEAPLPPARSGSQPATAPGQTAPSAGQRNSLMADWAGKIRARIDRKRSYPAAARAAGLTGTVTLSLEIAPDGQVLNVRVAQSSGHAALDQAALAAVARAGRLPRAPKGLTGARHAFRLPLSFRL